MLCYRDRGSLALKTWALDIARRSTMRKARVASCQTRRHHVRHAETRRRVRAGIAPLPPEIGGRDELPREHDPREGANRMVPIFCRTADTMQRPVRFQQAASHPADPITGNATTQTSP